MIESWIANNLIPLKCGDAASMRDELASQATWLTPLMIAQKHKLAFCTDEQETDNLSVYTSIHLSLPLPSSSPFQRLSSHRVFFKNVPLSALPMSRGSPCVAISSDVSVVSVDLSDESWGRSPGSVAQHDAISA